MIYEFKDGKFQFYTAKYSFLDNDIKIIFRVRLDRDPYERAKDKNIKNFQRLYISSEDEIKEWLKTHSDYSIINNYKKI